MTSATAARTQTIRDTFTRAAICAGLTHTGGQGAYSEMTGTVEQWTALGDYIRSNAGLYSAASVRAVLSRIDWACA